MLLISVAGRNREIEIWQRRYFGSFANHAYSFCDAVNARRSSLLDMLAA